MQTRILAAVIAWMSTRMAELRERDSEEGSLSEDVLWNALMAGGAITLAALIIGALVAKTKGWI